MKGQESGGGGRSGTGLHDARDEEAVEACCRTVLETISPGRVKRSPRGGNHYIQLPHGGGAWWVYLGLWYEDIAVRIYPGNTTRQAQNFFASVSKREFFGLESKGWQIEPYLCFCYMAWGRPANGCELTPEEYFDYWASEEIKQIRREDDGFEGLSQQLRAQRIIDAGDQRNIERDFIETKRDFMNVCPGFELIFSWQRAKADRLDHDGRFAEAVRARANEALRTWGQTL
jgi:hypothetical protein